MRGFERGFEEVYGWLVKVSDWDSIMFCVWLVFCFD